MSNFNLNVVAGPETGRREEVEHDGRSNVVVDKVQRKIVDHVWIETE